MKELLKFIKECDNDEDIEYVADALIDCFSKESFEKNHHHDTIGSLTGVSPSEDVFKDKNVIYSINAWVGYIPKGTKIVYGTYTDSNNYAYTKGSYYYLDDDSYVYEFFKYLKDKDVEDLNDLILYIHKFLTLYLGKNYNSLDREEMHKLFYMNDNTYFKPAKEHSIRDFYHNGSAMCTEYSVMGCNLLCVFGLCAMVIMDEYHAFNILIDDKDTGSIIDFSNYVVVKDLYNRFLTHVPFFEEIEGSNLENIQNFVNSKEKIELEDYYYLYINGSFYKALTGDVRTYGMETGNVTKKHFII